MITKELIKKQYGYRLSKEENAQARRILNELRKGKIEDFTMRATDKKRIPFSYRLTEREHAIMDIIITMCKIGASESEIEHEILNLPAYKEYLEQDRAKLNYLNRVTDY